MDVIVADGSERRQHINYFDGAWVGSKIGQSSLGGGSLNSASSHSFSASHATMFFYAQCYF